MVNIFKLKVPIKYNLLHYNDENLIVGKHYKIYALKDECLEWEWEIGTILSCITRHGKKTLYYMENNHIYSSNMQHWRLVLEDFE